MTTISSPMRTGYRYICCSRCGVRWNVGTEYDTRRGYYCPDCNRYRDKQDAIKTNRDYFVHTFFGKWHGVRQPRKGDKNDKR